MKRHLFISMTSVLFELVLLPFILNDCWCRSSGNDPVQLPVDDVTDGARFVSAMSSQVPVPRAWRPS